MVRNFFFVNIFGLDLMHMHFLTLIVLNLTSIIIAVLFIYSFSSVVFHFVSCLLDEISILGKLAIPITNLTTTFTTLIYSYCFFITSKPHHHNNSFDDEDYSENVSLDTQKIVVFFDLDLDGQVGIIDLLASVAGIINSLCLLVDMVLWYEGFLSTSDVVTTLPAMNRVISLFITRSYMIPVEENQFKSIKEEKKKGWIKRIINQLMQFIDINNDDQFQLVDVISFSVTSTYLITISLCWILLISSDSGNANIIDCVNLISALTTPLATIFGCSFLLNKKAPLPMLKEFVIFSCCLLYVVFLIRTVLEMKLQNKLSVDLMSKLSNGLVIPVVQLFSAFLIHRKQDSPSMKSIKRIK